MSGGWLDLSPPVSPGLAVWPGDTPCAREVLMDLARGDSVTLSTLRSTVHLGAHADGPNHYTLHGGDVASQPIDRYLGPCQIIDAPGARGGRVGVGHLRCALDAVRAPRVIIRSGTFPDPARWNSDFAGLEPALVHALADRGVFTIAVDTPSVDPQASKDLPAHAACAARDVAILEGLTLGAVPARGDGQPVSGELIALPLRLEGFDASPVRAVFRVTP